MQIGIITSLADDSQWFDHVERFGLKVCQLMSWDMSLATAAIAKAVKAESERTGVRVCAVWAGVPGPRKWNFVEGPSTLGLVPPMYRKERVEALKRWADFAEIIKTKAIITHCGFIPENLDDPNYADTVAAIAEVATYCKRKGLEFWFETGQETPVVLLRVIEQVATGNLGINLDPANLLLYGKGNPIDALDVFGQYVRNIHVKDGFYPTTGNNLGREAKVGEGKVNFPEFMKKLVSIGYQGELIIEREISGDQQIKDIRDTITYLKKHGGTV